MDRNHGFTYPQMAWVRQRLSLASLPDIEFAVVKALTACPALQSAKKNATVAVAVGSRGIYALDRIVRTCVRVLTEKGLQPFLVPAMGSHGGATPAGQAAVLAALNITEESTGAILRTDMAVDHLGDLACGMPVFFSRVARQADYVLPINRIKPHTKFAGPVESGLVKMLTVGCGKAAGAAAIHRFALQHSFDVIPEAAEHILGAVNVLCGLAILEDGRGCTARIEVVAPTDIMEREPIFLQEAYALMAGIPFDSLDVLVVDQIGKDISGIGMDSNVTGRHRDITGNFFRTPHVKRIFVRDLSPASAGNANGIGLADFTTTRLVRAMDREKTYANALTAISPEKAAIPLYFDTDREAIAAAVESCGYTSGETVRMVRIVDTAHLERLSVSRTLEKEVADNADLTMAGDWEPMRFGGNGNLADDVGDC